MKLVIAGSRSITDYDEVLMAISASSFKTITEIVSGKARGVDTLGEDYARNKGIPIKEFPADWKRLGNAAGPIRNAQMAEYADAAIVIWDGKSTGSKNMIEQMKKLNKPCFVWKVPL